MGFGKAFATRRGVLETKDFEGRIGQAFPQREVLPQILKVLRGLLLPPILASEKGTYTFNT